MKNPEKNLGGRPKTDFKAPRKNTSINMKVSETEILMERIKSVGLATLGDVAQIIVKHPEVIEAFRPHAEEQMKPVRTATGDPVIGKKLEMSLKALRETNPEKFKKLIEKIEE